MSKTFTPAAEKLEFLQTLLAFTLEAERTPAWYQAALEMIRSEATAPPR